MPASHQHYRRPGPASASEETEADQDPLSAYDVIDTRKRDCGLTSSDLLRSQLRRLRSRVRRVQSFSESPVKSERKRLRRRKRSASLGAAVDERYEGESEGVEVGLDGVYADGSSNDGKSKKLSPSRSAPTFLSGSVHSAHSQHSDTTPLLFPFEAAAADCSGNAAAYGSTGIEGLGNTPAIATATVLGQNDEETVEAALAVPLLAEEQVDLESDLDTGNADVTNLEEGTEEGGNIDNTNNGSMSETPPSSGNADAAASPNNNTSNSGSSLLNRITSLVLKCPTAADGFHSASHPICLLPSLLLTNGKYTALGLPALYIILFIIWLPLWALSYLLTEAGVYLLILGSIYKAGRSLIRLIAFPGASHRVYGEVEAEFGRYSCRMLDAACGVVIEAASALIAVGGGIPSDLVGSGSQDNDDGTAPGLMSKVESMMAPVSQYGYYDLGPLWSRAVSYRDRVLGVYVEVLRVVLENAGQQVPGMEGTASVASDSQQQPIPRTVYGNNPLVGDIGDLADVSPDAVEEGVTFTELLHKVLVAMKRVEETAGSAITCGTRRSEGGSGISVEARRAAVSLLRSTTELREMLPSLKPPSASSNGSGSDEGQDEENPHHDDDENMDALRKRLQQEKNATPMEAIKHGAASILPMLDPPPHSSVFGLDVLRGCMLSRYQGSKQIWVPRCGGRGRVDVLYLPTPKASNAGGHSGEKRRAVMYCNPNAGLMEVVSGMSLIGGNVTPSDGSGSEQESCWVDFYTQRGYDVYVFNYAGFGRSSGGRGGNGPASDRTPGSLGRILRIIRGSIWDFAPSPKSMKADALAVARYIVDDIGVERFVIHGESIGGMAASSAARGLGNVSGVCVGRGLAGPLDVPSASQPSLLICDRSFCNLEAVAERLVGGWSGKAIRMLTPFWNTDVAGDFMASRCPKIVANDAADSIIADSASLKSGLAVSKEMRQCATWGVARMSTAPVEYRMADWENVGVAESKYFNAYHVQPPVWPADKHIALREAYHFAACARRVGKVATALRKELSQEARRRRSTMSAFDSEDEDGIEITELSLHKSNGSASTTPNSHPGSTRSDEDRVLEAWKALACCDGMCGAPLGSTIKDGYDCTVTWLCSTVIYGVQIIADAAETRSLQANQGSISPDINVLPPDFSRAPVTGAENGPAVYPIPIPEVVSTLRNIVEEGTSLLGIQAELNYCIAVLEYVVARATATNVVADSLKVRHLSTESETLLTTGCFLDLNCGHNNQYSAAERENLWNLMEKVLPAR